LKNLVLQCTVIGVDKSSVCPKFQGIFFVLGFDPVDFECLDDNGYAKVLHIEFLLMKGAEPKPRPELR
jgi:hypothetical protein